MKNKKIHDIIMLHGSDIIKSNNINIQNLNVNDIRKIIYRFEESIGLYSKKSQNVY